MLNSFASDLGTVGASLAIQLHEWPLSTASSLLAPYRLRESRQPDLDLVASAKAVESHVTPDLLQQKVYVPFLAEQASLPAALLGAACRENARFGIMDELATVWVSTPQETLFWDLRSNEVKEFAAGEPVVDIVCGSPNKDVLSDEIKHVLVVSTSTQMVIYAVDGQHRFVQTGLSVPLDGTPLVRVTKDGRIFFASSHSGTALWEFKYHAQESFFRPRVQKVCYGETGGIFGGLFGSKPSAENVLDFVVDESNNALYALTSKGALHAYTYARNSGLVLVKNFSAAQIQTRQRQMRPPAQPNQPASTAPISPLVSISVVSRKESRFIRVVALTASGERLYFRTDENRPLSSLTLAFAHALPIEANVVEGAVLGGRVTHALVSPTSKAASTSEGPQKPTSSGLSGASTASNGASTALNGASTASNVTSTASNASNGTSKGAKPYRIFASAIDEVRVRHLCDLQNVPIAFVELGGWMELDNRPVASVNTAILTRTSLYRLEKRAFSDRFEYADVPLALAPIYGPMQLCEGALQHAAVAKTRFARENALASFFRFGGTPSFRKDSLLPRSSIRLSACFDGLAAWLAHILHPLWDHKVLGFKGDFDSVYNELSALVELLKRNRGFGDSRGIEITSADDAAVLSQAEYKGLLALAGLARSSQEGIAFLSLVLRKYNTEQVLSYFDAAKKPKLKELTFGEFFTEAKNSEVARELVNSLVNFVLARGESVDAVAAVIQDKCASYCSAGDVLEYKALEYIHRAKQARQPDLANLAKSVALVKKAAGSIQLETLRDVIRDFVELKYYIGAVQAGLAVAAEQDPANVALAVLRRAPERDGGDGDADAVEGNDTAESNAKRLKLEYGTIGRSDPLSPATTKYLAKMAVFNIIFEEVLDRVPELTEGKNPARLAMLNSPDEVWHFALYGWYLEHGKQDQIALLDTPFVATYLEVGAHRDVRVADLLWKWHQRHGDLLAAADVLLDLAKGPLVPTLAMRVAYLSRAQGYCQAQDSQQQFHNVNMLTMVRAYLGLALIQSDILAHIPKEDQQPLNARILSISELYNEWAVPNELWEVCFAIFAFADVRDPVEIQNCWENCLTQARAQDDSQRSKHYAHVADLVARLGQKYRGYEAIFAVTKLVPMLEHYAVDYCPDAPEGWLIDALLRADVQLDFLVDVYTDVLANNVLEGSYAVSAKESLEYAKHVNDASDL